ncbi:hypothetical protein KSP35_11625 [Aquihabitans sp. G128]|uniref:hypothetical protein n=1 Tax=Aquihabitans sp. G128 TaxID=2849779 RepID=UPI001C23629A|nr:hypothetical protein [Aquihabitans sp. G128]QXC63376.1 hypothetical protein KSP35_11625 [Aquihabitans sp. G128]
MSRLEDVGDADGWRCWLCDEPVDPDMSVNDPRGPSIDTVLTKAKAKAKAKKGDDGQERLAHRGCNTGKGATAPVVPWPDHLFVVDPAPILAAVERLERKRGREAMARCPSEADAAEAAAWLVDRISRLRPALEVTAEVEAGGGQHVVLLRS